MIPILQNNKINILVLLTVVIGTIIVIASVLLMGSKTIERRKQLENIENEIIDKETGEVAHISGSLLEIKDKIKNGDISEKELTVAAQKSIIELYEFANKYDISNSDMRTQQLIYNIALAKNQSDPLLLLFGNGYIANYRELVLEIETVALVINFGLFGFVLYFMPVLSIFLYGCYFGIVNKKKIDIEYLMLLRWTFM